MTATKREKKISVVVPCAKNRKFELKTLIPSLHAQSYKKYEVIVETWGTCGQNRNRGAKKARGEILLFCDSDLIFSPHVLRLVNDTLHPGEILVYQKAGMFIAIFRGDFIPFDEKYIISEDVPWFNMMEKRGMKIRYIVENRNQDTTGTTWRKAFQNAVEWQMIPEMKWYRIIFSSIKTIIVQALVILGTLWGIISKNFKK